MRSVSKIRWLSKQDGTNRISKFLLLHYTVAVQQNTNIKIYNVQEDCAIGKIYIL